MKKNGGQKSHETVSLREPLFKKSSPKGKIMKILLLLSKVTMFWPLRDYG
jgi:hypothetical protein